jgi:hypothetical protein
MKRNLEILREILLATELAQGPFDLTDGRIEGHSFADLAHHTELLIEAGLLKGEVVYADAQGMPVYVRILRLTWAGHEFLATARDDRAWQEALHACPAGPEAMSFEVLCQVLNEAARGKLRLH